MDLPGTSGSYWIATTPHPGFPPMPDGARADVVVLGAGIVGLTVAYLLKQAGRSVLVLDAREVAAGVSGHTTAKVTVAHSLVYSHVRDRFGADAAATYAASNTAALRYMAGLVADEGIDCDWEPADSYLWAETPAQADRLLAEAQAAADAGLPATYEATLPLPWPVTGALRMPEQAQFHPRRYLLHLAGAVDGDGSMVHEHTRALDVREREGEPCVVTTDRGEARATHVVVATHLPILDRGAFFTKVHPYREYVLTVRVPAESVPAGMYLSIGSPTRSLRGVPGSDGPLLLVSGEKHRTGEDPATDERYRDLLDWTERHFPVEAVTHRWSTQDTYSLDGVPYIGRLTRGSAHLWTATGFNGWGMTGGTLAGMLLADQITGRDNPWAALYDAKRLKPAASLKSFVTENLEVGKHVVTDRLARHGPDRVADLAPGDGAVMKVDGRNLAVCRDESGRVHGVTATCTHLGCLVAWNRGESSWDCPCHGSRFAPDGSVLHGPAVHPLERREVPRDV